jgi:nicotinate-nucleotide pyrophosphorylase (carboxylating)
MVAELFDGLIDAALKEDMPAGDITSENIIPPGSVSKASFLAKEEGVLAGVDVARRIFEKIDPSISFVKVFEDGRSFGPGDILARLEGRSISLLKGERTALNFVQRMSGIATKTSEFIHAVEGTKTKVLDTRKTTPGLRLLEKYAVRMGGGVNHRFSLSDMVLIKDNHIEIIGSVSEAVRRARAGIAPGIRIEVEVTGFEGAREALESGADMIMLDNMPLDKMKEVVEWIRGRVPVEVSGRVTVRNARQIAALGVDFISVGALTHSSRSIDISLEFEGRSGR